MCKRIFKGETFTEGDIPFYKIGTFGSVPDAYISREQYEDYKTKFSFPKKGDILLSASGTIGRIVEYNGEEAYYQDSNIVWLSHDKTISNKFLKVLYPTIKWDGIEGSTIKRLYNDNFLRTQFLIPKIEEQEQLGIFFDCLDNLITLHQRDSFCQILIAKMITSPWEQRKVSEMFKITRGYVLAAPLTSEKPKAEMPYPVYSSQTKENGLMGYYNKFLYENAITWTTDGANAGTVNYRAGKFYCTNVCGVLLSDKATPNQMIAEALNNVAKSHVSYVGNPKLMNNVMSEIVITLAKSGEEQLRISAFLRQLDNLITLHQRKYK